MIDHHKANNNNNNSNRKKSILGVREREREREREKIVQLVLMAPTNMPIVVAMKSR